MRWLCRRDYNSDFVRTFAQHLLQASRPEKPKDPVETFFLFARDQIKFREDEGPNGESDVERIADFKTTTELRWGDCDDKVIWLGTSLLNRGIGCRFRVQSYGRQTWDHVYLDYWDWGHFRWIALDPTADGHTGIVAEIGWRQPLGPMGLEMIYPI